jgi:redox-sensitive bicupin YhaK (pirin superfamily)
MPADRGDLEVLIAAREESIGTFSVRRTLPSARRRMVGPFAFLDHMGPTSARLNVLPHPHIGLATLTYLFDGEVLHRDSLGNAQTIRPREVNWMVAGRGIAHSERGDAAHSGTMHGIQAWVALPEENEETDPDFTHFDTHQLPRIEDTGVDARLLSGSAYGLASPAPSFSPHFYIAARLESGARIALPREHRERAAYIAAGAIRFAGETYGVGQLLVASPGGEPVLVADDDAEVLMLGGQPLGKRFMWWNFVSSRKERIEEAKEDWLAQRIALPPGDDREFVPLPPDLRPKPPQPEPMS